MLPFFTRPPEPAPAADTPPADPLAARNMFVFSQKKRAPGDKLFVYDEAGAPLLFVDHPPLAKLSAPTTVYTDETRATRLLTLFQSTPSLPGVPAVYLVLDANDNKLATLRRSHGALSGTAWRVYDARPAAASEEPAPAAGKKAAPRLLLAEAHEEGHWKKFVRGLPYVEAVGVGALLKTNFVLTGARGDKKKPGRILGYFVRGFTVVEKFVLDLKPDARARTLDRRVALALALVLEIS